VVISAYNEEACIEERIKNLLSLEYTHDPKCVKTSLTG